MGTRAPFVSARRGRAALVAGLVTATALFLSAGVAAAGEDDGHSKSSPKSTAKSKAKAKAKSKAKTKAKAKGMKHMAGMDHDMADDKGLSLLSNGHHDMIGETEHQLDPAERAALSAQVSATIDVARKYPTVTDVLAAGYQQVGPYMPGIGAHYIQLGGNAFNPDGVMDPADLAEPLAIIYDGTEPTSVVAGFMYYSMSKEEPSGFAGANDVWHYHEDLCLKYTPTGIQTPYGLDKSATKKECDAAGASLLKQSQWMVHVWSVPGWESRQGLFGEVNPALMCPDGTYYQYPKKGWLSHPKNVCKSAA